MGANRDRIRDQFHYVKPDEQIGTGINRDDLHRLLDEHAPTLVVVDGITATGATAVSAGLAGYWIYLSVSAITTNRLATLLVVFMSSSVLASMATAQDPAWWEYHFSQLGTADDIELVDELHVKVNTTYHYKLEASDVMHSFSVPVFRLKQDAIPGREITGWFKPTITGEFDVQCTEICGIGHALMPARIKIETESEHAEWLASKSTKNG